MVCPDTAAPNLAEKRRQNWSEGSMSNSAFRELDRVVETLTRAVESGLYRPGERAALRSALGAVKGVNLAVTARCESGGPDYRERQLPVGDR